MPNKGDFLERYKADIIGPMTLPPGTDKKQDYENRLYEICLAVLVGF